MPPQLPAGRVVGDEAEPVVHGVGAARSQRDRDGLAHLGQLVPTDQPAGEQRLVETVGESPESYSNTNYIVLGLLLDKVSGMPAERYVTRHVIQRADLEHTFFPEAPPLDADAHHEAAQHQGEERPSERDRSAKRRGEEHRCPVERCADAAGEADRAETALGGADVALDARL
ncbi:serine hydrolase [Microtetraspora malaysiensis]|uniref:Serine hydrolase n=1 Tax=Microtetraspora malaysiensis TaxID=161358 RepID=A0ABW6SWT3_9ACTN